MQDFIHWFVYPLCVTALVALSTAALTKPKLFNMFSPQLLLWGVIATTFLVGYDCAVDRIEKTVSRTNPDMGTINAQGVPWWIPIAMGAVTMLIATFGIISEKLHVAALGESEGQKRPPPEPPVDAERHV